MNFLEFFMTPYVSPYGRLKSGQKSWFGGPRRSQWSRNRCPKVGSPDWYMNRARVRMRAWGDRPNRPFWPGPVWRMICLSLTRGFPTGKCLWTRKANGFKCEGDVRP